MATCEHCEALLLDYVYGLLEENELQEIRAHLANCDVCQSALKKVRGHQALLANAARAVREVPAFSAPSEVSVAVPPNASSLADPLIAFPSVVDRTGRPRYWPSRWVIWTSAAAIFLAVSASLSAYRTKLHALEKDLAEGQQQQRQTEERIAALPAKYAAEQHVSLQQIRAGISPYLHVVGPTVLETGSSAHLVVTTRGVEGQALPAKIIVKLVDPVTSQSKLERSMDSTGEARIAMDAPADVAGRHLRLEVEALAATGKVQLQESVYVPESNYVARVDLNKDIYRIKDVLFYRGVVLERYTLKPPTRPLLLRVGLLDPRQETIQHFEVWSKDGGIVSGTIPLPENYLPGLYALHIGALDDSPGTGSTGAAFASSEVFFAALPLGNQVSLTGAAWFSNNSSARVQTAVRRFELVRAFSLPGIQLDQAHYRAGDVVNGSLAGGPPTDVAKATLAGQPVPLTLQPALPTFGMRNGNNSAESAGGAKAKTDALGAALGTNTATRRFAMRIPENVPGGINPLPLKITWPNGDRSAELNALIPLQSNDFAIDLFPEGGNLVAGVSNRVFYRVRFKNGEAVGGVGGVALLAGKSMVADSRYENGVGSFDFVPDSKKSYIVRISAPAKSTEIAAPFAALGGIRSSGVVLHIPVAVVRQGEPIKLKLRNPGPRRKLLVIAECRGQIIDQQWADIGRNSRDMTLQTPSTARGAVRVTVYEMQGKVLDPVAERLVYCLPNERLDLDVQLNAQRFRPGQAVTATIRARNKKGEPAAPWLLATVVDQRFQESPKSLSAHLLLFNEIRTGADLDNAQVDVGDSPESIRLLDRFLGTHGWRRFVRTDAAQPLRADRVRGGGSELAVPMVFSRESAPLADLQKQYEEKLAQVVAPLRQTAFREGIELDEQHQKVTEAVYAQTLKLRNFDDTVREGLRLAARVVLGLLVAGGVVLMLVGGYRLFGHTRRATPAFGGAFVCLAVCLIGLLLGQYLSPLDGLPAVPNKNAEFAWGTHNQLEQLFSKTAKQKRMDAPAPPAVVISKEVDQKGRMEANRRLTDEAVDAPRMQDGQGGFEQLANRTDRAMDRPESRPRGQLSDAKKSPPPMAQNAPAALAAPSDPAGRSTTVTQADKAAKEDKKALGSRDQGPPPPTPSPPAGGAPLMPRAAAKIAAIGAPKKANGAAPLAQAKRLEESARVERQFAYQHAPNLAADTLLWSPSLRLIDGTAEVHFDISGDQARYRFLLLAHTPEGRFGFYETYLDVTKD